MTAAQHEVPTATKWPKVCLVCSTKYDKAAWAVLPLLEPGGRGVYEGVPYEFKNCPCGNTLTVVGEVAP